MTLPKKGSRKIEVDGRRFRYVINPVKDLGVSVTVEDAERPASVFAYTWPKGHSVLPSDLRDHIRAALQQGWKPEAKGPPFHISYVHLAGHPHHN